MKTKAERHAYLGKLVRRELLQAEGGEDDELQGNRDMALQYYFGLPRGDEEEGRSQVVSTDVADVVNATLATMRDMLIREAEVGVDPLSDDDEVQAQIEADVLNDVLMKDNPGERELLAALKDALLLKNGCLKVHVQDHEETEELEIPDGTPSEQIAAWIAAAPEGEERSAKGYAATVTRMRRRFEVRAVPIENVSYQAAYQGRLQDIRFFAERLYYTRSELVEMGIDRAKVDALPAWTDDATADAGQRRNSSYQPGADAETRDQDQIECHEAYLLVDMDGDGISERYRVLLAAENTCLEYERAPLVPYAMGSPFLVPHRLTGESLFDRLWQTQDTNTALTRQLIDNVTLINNGRYVYDPNRVMEEDIMTPQAGGGIRARDPSSVVPLVTPDVTGGILAALEFTRRQRSEKAGAALDMASAEAQLVNKSATAASIEKGNQELVTNLIAANLASTMMRDLYLLLHEHLRRYAREPYTVRVAGQAVQTDPRSWPARTRLTVRAGMSPSTKAEMKMALGQHVQLQAQALSAGMAGILASPETLYRTVQEWLALHGVQAPERHAIDPRSQGAQEAMQRAQQAQQMAQQMAAAEAERAQRLEAAKLQEDARQHDTELTFKYWAEQAQAEIEEAKIAGSGVIELEKQRMSADAAERQAARAAAGGAADTGGADR